MEFDLNVGDAFSYTNSRIHKPLGTDDKTNYTLRFNTYNKIQDFQCEQCDYSASRNSTLKTHIKAVHNKMKDYGCEQCDYTAS